MRASKKKVPGEWNGNTKKRTEEKQGPTGGYSPQVRRGVRLRQKKKKSSRQPSPKILREVLPVEGGNGHGKGKNSGMKELRRHFAMIPDGPSSLFGKGGTTGQSHVRKGRGSQGLNILVVPRLNHSLYPRGGAGENVKRQMRSQTGR